tara:strand:+ start:2807 stop:3679 length:873 start_codon:yes stop_codon:yes gene_type:complete
MVKSILKSFGLSKVQSNPREEIQDIISEEGQKEEAFDAHEKILLKNILGLRAITASDVMVPRADIVAVDIDESSENIVKKMTTAGHSRLPVFKGALDKVLGVIHIKDITSKISENENIDVKSLLRPAIFSSPSLRLLDLLQEMRLKRLHLALVLDEFGGVDGLLTIEDLVEEIVGEIQDEHDDPDAPLVSNSGNGILLADARLEMEELEQITGKLTTNESDFEIDTLGGLICSIVGRVPGRGECIRHPTGIEFQIIEGDARRVRKVKIRGVDQKRIDSSNIILRNERTNL